MFVSRAKYDLLRTTCETWEKSSHAWSGQCDGLLRALEAAREDLREQRAYNRTLVQTIVDMRREGFASLPATATPSVRSSRANVEEAIRLASGGDKGHASVLRAYVASKRAEGLSDDDIAHDLLQPAPAEVDGVPA